MIRVKLPRMAALAAVTILGPGSGSGSEPVQPRRPVSESADRPLLKRMLGPAVWPRVAAGAAIQQVRHSPYEWGQGAAGFGRRFGSILGKHVVSSTVSFGVGAWRREQLRYDRLGEGGFGPRAGHALLRTVVARKKGSGESTVAAGKISGALAGGFVSRLWQPARLRTVSGGFASAGISVGADAGANVVREFWPEIRHPRASRREREARSRKIEE